MATASRIGLLGGTFDPIHFGHLAAADAARTALCLDEVLLLPSHVPPHRPQPVASVHHRFAMVALAVADHPAFRASDLELAQPGPSYTAATLGRLRALGYLPSQLFFITGADAFAEIATWREYPHFLDAAHFVAVNRAGRSAASLRRTLPTLAARMRVVTPHEPVVVEPGASPLILLVDGTTPDTSSTAVRVRAAQGLSLSGLVPPLVGQHIARHHLYPAGAGSSSPTGGHRPSADELHEQEHR